MNISSQQLRTKYLEFFKSKQHAVVSSASLIPENDPTVLFTTAGMQPLVPYLLGQKHPQGTRLVDVQKCVRTGDIDEVGDKTHLTFFEMLGNWSLGDYWKQESISWSFEFLTKELGIPLEKLAVTCFEGEEGIPRDDEAAEIWKQLGMPEDRIFFLGRKDNWWGPAGQTGPCGPDTEIFYWTGEGEPGDISDPHWVEIWNNVFMQYNKTAEGTYEPLSQQNVDTGMGLERTTAILNGFSDVYSIDAFQVIIKKIEELSNKKYAFEKGDLGLDQKPDCWEDDVQSMRIIADHLRAVIMIMGDSKGIAPSNVDQGYVVRKLIRRAIRHGKKLGIAENFTTTIAQVIIEQYSDVYEEIKANQEFALNNLSQEEEKFNQTLEKGLKEFEKISSEGSSVSGEQAFQLFATYGFPLEMTKDLAKEKQMTVDQQGFEQEFSKHQELSRTASAGKFKGGLADHSEETTKFHTATHLLHAALRQVLGDHVFQKGSNITQDRLRFDFSHPDKLTAEQKQAVEDLINEKIKEDLPVTMEEMPLEKAKELGAMGVFESKYEEVVKVYTIGKGDNVFSREICGGPHVEKTGDIGPIKIKKEEASSAGVRRIKANFA